MTNMPPNITALRERRNVQLIDYRNIAILTEGFSSPFLAKTAINLLRYRTDDVVAVIDSAEAGMTAGGLFGVGGEIPVAESLDGFPVDALFLGIAPPGGVLPTTWRSVILDALERGIDVVSGLHEFLGDDAEFVDMAERNGCRLVDVRRNDEHVTSTGTPFREGCLRVLTVGQDCSVGKMVVAVEVQRELVRRDVDAQFVATGQTGIMIVGDGVPIDCVVSDFVNGAVESLVRRHEQHDIVLVEGQGSISHPSFSAVTLGLLHGAAPDGMIYCYEYGRTHVKGLDSVPLLSHRRLIDAYLSTASLRHGSRMLGIAMNGRHANAEEAAAECERMASEFGLPVCDVYRDGPGPLADAVLRMKSRMHT